MFFLVDKPVGPSCNQILSHFKRKYKTKKAGHVGTLDPKASGLLIIATHGSTKLIPYLEKKDKTYEFEFDITKTSDSLDLDTPLVAWIGDEDTLKKRCDQKGVQDACREFIGKLYQKPPSYSAIWIDGRRSYRIARERNTSKEMSACENKKEVLLHDKKRLIEIYSIELISINFPYITLRARVSSGTYIRTLAYDIGKMLGGTAVITKLRRIGYDKLFITHEKINNQIVLEKINFHTNESTHIAQVDYPFLFPGFGNKDINKEEYTELHRGNGILITKKEYLSLEDSPVICNYQKIPVSLCRAVQKGEFYQLQILKNDI